MKKIFLIGRKGEGMYAMVDDGDYEKVSRYRWHYNNGYAISDFGVRMHRFIMNPPQNLVIDHINHDRLDNRRSNLKICTQFENSQNRTHAKATYGNVYSNKDVTKWYACNMIDGKRIRSKNYDTYEEAEEALMLMRKGITVCMKL